MQFNLFTFGLELVNFVVLAWVLSRILYKPIRAVLHKRQAEARALLAEADKARSDATALEARYQERLAESAHAEAARRAELERELSDERTRRLARLDEELRAEREAETLARAQRADAERARTEAEAIHLAAAFASRLLAELAGPELHRRILQRFVAAVPKLPAEMLRPARIDGAIIDVRSAYPLEAIDRDGLARAFAEILHEPVRVDVHDAPELIAGVEVHVGAAALEANVARELAFFAETADA